MQSAPIDLQLVRRRFEQLARQEGAAFLRREVAHRMQEKLALVNIQAKMVSDLGCGEGADLAMLAERFPQADIIGLDASAAALQKAQELHQQGLNKWTQWWAKWTSRPVHRAFPYRFICDDFAQTSLASQSMDVLWSNMALHWHPEPDQVLKEWFRLLRKEGLVMFSCLGPDSLSELRQAFAQVDDYPHSLPFVDMHDYGDMLVKAGFATPVMDVERLTLRYQTVAQLWADVRALGGFPMQNRRKTCWGRQAYARVLAAFEAQRESDGRIPLTIELVFGHAFKPEPKHRSSGEAIIRLDFPKKT